MTEGLLIKDVLLDGSIKDIYIKGNRIVSVGTVQDVPEGTRVLDARGKAAVPGFVNMHTHAAMTLTRGVEEDLPLEPWLETIWRVESGLDEEMIYWGTRLAALEMTKAGVTSFCDQYWMPSVAARAVADSGIRSWNSYVVMDFGDSAKSRLQKDEFMKAYEESRAWDSRCTFVASCHSVYTVSEQMLLWVREFSRKNGLLFHIHVSETETEVANCRQKTGMSPVRYLDSLGLLGPDVIAAHTLWLDEEDVEILGRNRVNVVHNINSNLKIASGYRFLYRELREAGANVTIGTDGCASSNNLDILEAMKTAAMVQKAWRKDPKVMPLAELLAMATSSGCRALGLEAGTIAPGMMADIALVDLRRPAFVPNISFLSNLVYSAHSDCIDTLVCDGKVVMEGRKVPGEEIVLKEASAAACRLLEKAGASYEPLQW